MHQEQPNSGTPESATREAIVKFQESLLAVHGKNFMGKSEEAKMHLRIITEAGNNQHFFILDTDELKRKVADLNKSAIREIGFLVKCL